MKIYGFLSLLVCISAGLYGWSVAEPLIHMYRRGITNLPPIPVSQVAGATFVAIITFGAGINWLFGKRRHY